MNKFFLFILAVIYLGTSNGATIHMHYCMGKLVDWRLWDNKHSNCNNCGMDMDHGSKEDDCCKDEYKKIKNEKDQKITETTFSFTHSISVAILSLPVELRPINISTLTESNPVSHAPPRRQVAIYIINRVFLI